MYKFAYTLTPQAQLVNTKTAPHVKSARRLKFFLQGFSNRSRRLVHKLHDNLGPTLGLVGTALRASGVTGNGCTALGALAEFGCLPGLSGQAGALLHLGRSAFRSCHSSVFRLRCY